MEAGERETEQARELEDMHTDREDDGNWGEPERAPT